VCEDGTVKRKALAHVTIVVVVLPNLQRKTSLILHLLWNYLSWLVDHITDPRFVGTVAAVMSRDRRDVRVSN